MKTLNISDARYEQLLRVLGEVVEEAERNASEDYDSKIELWAVVANSTVDNG